MEQGIQIGNLVQIKKWCRDKGRLAHVVEAPSWDNACVKIQFIDEQGLGELPIWAQRTNLILITTKDGENK